MPFVPLTPEEKKTCPKPCTHPEHNPPGHIVIRKAVRYVCPACGKSVIIRPKDIMGS